MKEILRTIIEIAVDTNAKTNEKKHQRTLLTLERARALGAVVVNDVQRDTKSERQRPPCEKVTVNGHFLSTACITSRPKSVSSQVLNTTRDVRVTGCECTYAMCTAERKSDYKTWRWFSYLLHLALSRLDSAEYDEKVVYSGETRHHSTHRTARR